MRQSLPLAVGHNVTLLSILVRFVAIVIYNGYQNRMEVPGWSATQDKHPTDCSVVSQPISR